MSQGALVLHGDQPCPCARGGINAKPLRFAACCGQYLEGDTPPPAPDAESLMRSRYSAFVLQRESYLLATWHASTHPGQVSFDTAGKWLGLEVRNARASSPPKAETEAEVEVEFVARFKPAGATAWRLHERSRFVLQQGRWWYVDGVQLA
jgi:SEC-C motif-containing protein